MRFHNRARVVLTILMYSESETHLLFKKFPRSIRPNQDEEDPLKDMIPEHLCLDLPWSNTCFAYIINSGEASVHGKGAMDTGSANTTRI